MARLATKHSVRLQRLKAAVPKIMALPRGELLTSQPMANLLGVRWPSLREWCDEIEGFEESGAFQRGANGISYEFCPIRTLWFLIDHFQALTAVEVEKSDRVNAMALGPEAGVMRGIDLDDMRKILDAQGRLMDMRERAGELTKAEQVRAALSQVFSRMQEAALTAPQEMDPSGQWPPEVRAIVDKIMQGVLLRQRTAALRAIEGLRQGTN